MEINFLYFIFSVEEDNAELLRHATHFLSLSMLIRIESRDLFNFIISSTVTMVYLIEHNKGGRCHGGMLSYTPVV